MDALLDETTSLVDLVGPDTDSFDQRSAKYFLETLAYPEMYERSNQILYAFEDTFKWLFEPKDDPSPWSDFPTWLRDDGEEGTYWISAKPGSGKSTLIKYIDTTQSTRMHLRHWAKGRHVACASFYFWSAGSKMHNSWEGLFRSLLYRILKSKPDMIARYCPRRAQVHQLFGSYNLPWTTEELNKTLCSVLAEEETTFFFLVDGLDESCEDHEKLAMYLRGLAEQKNVKICLSSRQWPAFEDAFGSCPNLQLHELTGEDIRHFAKSQLGSSRGFQEREMGDKDFANFLIEEITHKSQGVFLWVKFVVHAILNDLRAGKRKEVLKERLEKLPVDLEDLFQKLLDMIEDDDKEEAYQIFQLVKAVRNPITLLMLSFAHEDGHSKDGQSNYLLELPCKQLSCKERMSRCEIMRRGLLAHCKGLLEVVPSPTQPPANSDHECIIDNDFDPPHPARTIPDAEVCKVDQLAGCIVQYMHRTVKEFLAKPDIWSSFKGVTASKPFSAHSALSRASLIRLKTADIATITNRWYWDVVCDTLHYAARSEAMGNAALVAELDELDRVADIIARTPWPKEPGGNLIQRHMGTPHPHQRVPRKVQAHEESQMHWSAAQTRESRHSFLCLAVQFGLLSYVEEKLISGSPVEQDPYSLSLLDCAIRDPEALSALPRVPSVGFDQRLSMMKMLFEHHDDPNRVDGYKRGPWIYLAKEIKKVHSVAWKPKRVKKHSRVFLAQPS